MASKFDEELKNLFAPHTKDFDALQEAVKEVQHERDEGKKEKAKVLIKRALELQEQMRTAENQFMSQKKKWEKEMGKVMNKINAMAAGKNLEEVEQEEKDKEEENKS